MMVYSYRYCLYPIHISEYSNDVVKERGSYSLHTQVTMFFCIVSCRKDTYLFLEIFLFLNETVKNLIQVWMLNNEV